MMGGRQGESPPITATTGGSALAEVYVEGGLLIYPLSAKVELPYDRLLTVGREIFICLGEMVVAEEAAVGREG